MLPFLVFLALGAADASAPSPVTVKVEKTTLMPGDKLVVTVENHLDESIFLPGCNHFLIEMKSGDGFKVVRQKQCFWEGLSVEIAAGKSERFEESIEGISAGTYRIRVDHSLGCKPGVPLSEGACRSQATAVSADITVR
ncbi:MAG: hypothetical protein U0166_21065 [Acidobacteriota bacterium]